MHKNLPRKHRKLEVAREMLEDEGDDDKPELDRFVLCTYVQDDVRAGYWLIKNWELCFILSAELLYCICTRLYLFTFDY
ncbi:hypothetical protein Ahy_B05g078448 isoform E [Arachis hypogaea]|nr:hypothetical protein Ahy_B05g078448 isoform E [Arachis hypogaea]